MTIIAHVKFSISNYFKNMSDLKNSLFGKKGAEILQGKKDKAEGKATVKADKGQKVKAKNVPVKKNVVQRASRGR